MFKKKAVKPEVKPSDKKVVEAIKKLPKKVYPADKATPDSLGKQKNALGRTHLQNFLSGKPINLKQAIQAKCYDCCGFYEDGIADCEQHKCPLYPFHPYNPNPARLRADKKKKE